MGDLLGLSAFTAYAAAGLGVARLVAHTVDAPYMDELFHVPQAQHYCRGEFRAWDPKLTTPPGLYLVSLALRPLLGCSLDALRLTNWVLGLGLFWTLYGLVRQLHGHVPATQAALAALTLSSFPLAYFFNHLYYTDTASLLSVLLAYWLCQKGRHTLAGALGFASLWMRQTNVVWVALIGCTAVMDWLRTHRGILRPGDALIQSLAQLVRWAVRIGANLPVLWVVAPYATVVALFGVFLTVNGGIVLGDKAHHQAGIHLPLLFYFYAYTLAAAAPTVLSLGAVRPARGLVLGAAACICMAIGVRRYTIEHPFLLSDNRHYTFYLWKDIFRRYPPARYLAIPLYLYSAVAVQRAIQAPALFKLALLLCTAAVLVPSPLLELRYFTVPFFFARLHMPMSTRALLLELAAYTAVNVATMWVFLNKPFTWDSEPGLQRFMW
ncbi:glucosyltransferase [Coemansia sp. RSA 552]|nr:glucosyltransferase [Coemansia sp. RSA 552]